MAVFYYDGRDGHGAAIYCVGSNRSAWRMAHCQSYWLVPGTYSE